MYNAGKSLMARLYPHHGNNLQPPKGEGLCELPYTLLTGGQSRTFTPNATTKTHKVPRANVPPRADGPPAGPDLPVAGRLLSFLLLTEELPPRVGVLTAPRNAVQIPPVEGQRQGPPEMRHFPSIAGSATLVIGHPPESREEPTPRPRGSMVLLFAFPRGKDERITPPNGPRTLRINRGRNTVDAVH